MRYEYVIDIARVSPCERRKYGAVIVSPDGWEVAKGFNDRVGNCCNGTCIRNELKIKHGSNTDAGAEIHAEQAALLTKVPGAGSAVYVAGLGPFGEPLFGFDSGPCYSCARMLAYANIRWVHLPVKKNDAIGWEAYNIFDIMNQWEREWEQDAELSTEIRN